MSSLDSPLSHENVALGAKTGFFAGSLDEVPLSYAIGDEFASFKEGAALIDLSACPQTLVNGKAAQQLVEAGCAGSRLAVGSCSFEAVLNGDGSVISVPLVSRTGDEEYLVLDASERSETLFAWLGFLAHIEQDGFSPYAGTEVANVAGQLVPLALFGPVAKTILSDYLRGGEKLPAAGEIGTVALDGHIHTLVLGLPAVLGEGFLLLCDPHAVVLLWRSLLSFKAVVPAGWKAFFQVVLAKLPPLKELASGQLHIKESTLREYGLLRDDGGFVGARGLKA